MDFSVVAVKIGIKIDLLDLGPHRVSRQERACKARLDKRIPCNGYRGLLQQVLSQHIALHQEILSESLLQHRRAFLGELPHCEAALKCQASYRKEKVEVGKRSCAEQAAVP